VLWVSMDFRTKRLIVVQNLATHANRITIQQKDMVLLQKLRRRLDPGYGGRN